MPILPSALTGLNDKNKKIVIVGGVAVLTYFIVMILVVKPASVKIKNFRDEKGAFTEKEPLLREVLAGEARLQVLQKKLTQSRDTAPLIQQLAEMAEKSSLKITSISPEKTASSQGSSLEKISILIESSGSFHQLGDFISRLESVDGAMIKVSRVEFGRSESSTASEPSVSADAKKILILVSMYYTNKDLLRP